MFFHNLSSLSRNRFLSVAALSMGSFLAVGIRAQDAPKPPSANDQAPANAPLPVIKTESRIVLVDAVVTDKKGNYVHDLKQDDFKVYEDNKEQAITSFTFGSDAAVQASSGQKRYLILFFDNSSMAVPDQIQARAAASKFIEQNSAPDRMMAIAEFGGSLQIKQNFTANADLLKSAVSGMQSPHLDTSGQSSVVASNSPLNTPSIGSGMSGSTMGGLSNAEADLGARSLFLSIRSLAKNLRSVPGRKMLILFSAGFPLDAERLSELTATIDTCNKANVAVYTLDVRGLASPMPGSSTLAPFRLSPYSIWSASSEISRAPQFQAQQSSPRLVLANFTLGSGDPQKPGGGGGTGTGGGGTGGGGHPGGGGTGTGGTGGTGGGKGTGTGTGTGTGGGKGTGTGTGTGTGSGSRGTGTGYNNNSYNNFYNNPATQPRSIVPLFPPSADINQQLLRALAEGTGGFAIYNSNDLLGGLNRIGREQGEFYILGYVPQSSNEGSCHTLKVKLNHGSGMEVRSRSGYCNSRPADPLEGKPVEKQLEMQATGSQAGSIQGSMKVPYYYSEPNVARVSLAMDVPSDALNFNKDKGKYHSNVNVLGIAYKPDGTVGARFSDTLDLNLEKDEWKEFSKQPYHYENQFDAAPGSYKLTVVFSAGGEHFGKFETPFVIAPYDGKKLTLGSIALSTEVQRLDQISSQMDAALVEDRTPLVVKGMQITPAAKYQFKKTDNIVLYSELYEPLLKSSSPPKLATGYRIFPKDSDKQVFFTGPVAVDEFIQKGNSVVPFALKLQVADLPPGEYKLVLLAVDGANNQAPQKEAEFSLTN